MRPAGLARATRRPGSGRSRVAGDEASFARPSMPWQHGDDRQDDGDGDQHDDDPLEDLHPAARRPVRHLGVDTVNRLQLSGDSIYAKKADPTASRPMEDLAGIIIGLNAVLVG